MQLAAGSSRRDGDHEPAALAPPAFSAARTEWADALIGPEWDHISYSAAVTWHIHSRRRDLMTSISAAGGSVLLVGRSSWVDSRNRTADVTML